MKTPTNYFTESDIPYYKGMAFKLQPDVFKQNKENKEKKRAISVLIPKRFGGINMQGGLTIKAVNLWLGYKRSKAMTHAMETL